jgi:hypothetical protein
MLGLTCTLLTFLLTLPQGADSCGEQPSLDDSGQTFGTGVQKASSSLLRSLPLFCSPIFLHLSLIPLQKIRVSSFKGSISDDVDATRARTGSAEACFILANKFPKDAEQEDAEAVVSAISARNFRKTLPVFIQINQSIHKLAIPSHIKEIICMQDLREAVLVQNCIAPGFLTVVHNLLSAFPPKEAKRKPIWLAEFTYGKSHQLETTVDLTALRDISFYDAVDGIYRHYSALLIGIASPSQRGVQILPPRSYKIQVFVYARALFTAFDLLSSIFF